jgi:HNH endonuclease
VQWRYRVHDTDGTLLYHGTTRARPHPDNTRHSGDPAGTDGDRACPDSSNLAGTHGDPTCAGSGSGGPASSGSGDRGYLDGRDRAHPEGKQQAAGQHRPRLHRALPCRQPNAPGSTSPQPTAPCPPHQADETARFPAARLRAWVSARDTTCRAPGCTAPARSCDVDHTIDHADGGATRHDNLGLLCRHHHRLKHEGGFQLDQPEPGHFRWTSPNGRAYDVTPDPP